MALPYRRSILSVAEKKNNEVQPKQVKRTRNVLFLQRRRRKGKANEELWLPEQYLL
jgi:hypothetical protein